ncbi:sugar phosphate isomerase/epimerase [Fontisphaera persica]|uniref:sugar phosphate isomerase/epimerase family protein n=1 Tax=Fontisphaera persica TaxID=2974023 RepID=UPI0024C0AB2D|nr:sugar phosphate isomerase/epimerase family protein [Fontisphaera persica]WCJ58078.1 sugar phosphate isomerase/epimerase [Fontisphaera persica]
MAHMKNSWFNRRHFLTTTTAALAGATLTPAWLQAAAARAQIKVGACVVNLEQAKQAGLEGVEVGVGGAAERLAIAEPATRTSYKAQMQATGLPICSLMMGLLNEYPLASDPRGPAWLEQSIDAAQDLGAKVILVAFFFRGDLLDEQGRLKEKEMDVVVQRLKDAAPRAKKAGVVLAIETYLNARDNLRILDAVNHEAVQMYYDVYNTGTTKKYDSPAEIRLMRDRIAQIHFKNGAKYLEDEPAKFEALAQAIHDIGYRGWIVLETSAPSKDAVADARKNAAFVRRLFA